MALSSEWTFRVDLAGPGLFTGTAKTKNTSQQALCCVEARAWARAASEEAVEAGAREDGVYLSHG